MGFGDDTIAQRVAKAIDELGCRKLIVKTDGEPALVNMQEAVAQKRLHETLIKNPPAYDPQANEGLKGRSQRSKHRCAPYKLAWSRDSACQWIQDGQSSSG